MINIEKTQEELLKDEAFEISHRIQRLTQRNESELNRIFHMVWNPQHGTSQDIFDEFGTQAKDLFILAESIQTLLAQLNPDFQPLTPPYDYTINEDGSVTVGDKIIEEVEISEEEIIEE